uniref:Uncharacterized protein n=1 Tax=Sinocyclocheilus anshuiensis TaxID=1608454 RepID=A0A671MEU2_9TELE
MKHCLVIGQQSIDILIIECLFFMYGKLPVLLLWQLHDCGITDEGCAALASALRSNPSHLRELDLSHNNIGDSGRRLFSLALDNPHCKLELLRYYHFTCHSYDTIFIISALAPFGESHQCVLF